MTAAVDAALVIIDYGVMYNEDGEAAYLNHRINPSMQSKELNQEVVAKD